MPINCNDQELGQVLHQLFLDGHAEVEIQHPIDGRKVITKAEFYGLVGTIESGSPAERMQIRKRAERAAAYQRAKFKRSMENAQVVYIDLERGQFGADSKGRTIPAQGMNLVSVGEYPVGIELLKNEVGAFVDPVQRKAPIRLVGV